MIVDVRICVWSFGWICVVDGWNNGRLYMEEHIMDVCRSITDGQYLLMMQTTAKNVIPYNALFAHWNYILC